MPNVRMQPSQDVNAPESTPPPPEAGGDAAWEPLDALDDAARDLTGRPEDAVGVENPSVAAGDEATSGEDYIALQQPAWDPRFPDRENLLETCREMDSILAAVLLFAGIVYSAFGYTLFKLAVIANIGGLGAWGGWWVGKQLQAPVPGMILGGLLAAAIAWPAMRYTVATCGGIVGFIVGIAVWRALGMADTYAPAGGLIGGIFLFMLSFILFKLSIMTFTATQGAVMLLGGLLGLFMKYPEVDDPVTGWIGSQPVILPVALFALGVVGLLFQQHYHREIPEDE